MKAHVPPGRYVVAVSGGVDSMVLLDLLIKMPGLALTVAHFDHGIREDSVMDRQLVAQVARAHKLPFVYDLAQLGPGASEAQARQARYDFLHKVRLASLATAIITAHHQDDMLETAIINLLRGTGRRGLSSLQSQDRLLRPLLHYEKSELEDYAREHGLQWREDHTNRDERYLRNYIRRQILTKFSDRQRLLLLKHVTTAQQLNNDLENLLANQLHIQPHANRLDRQWFIHLPHSVAREVLASWLRERGIGFDRKTLERLIVAAKTYKHHKRADINRGVYMEVKPQYLALAGLDR